MTTHTGSWSEHRGVTVIRKSTRRKGGHRKVALVQAGGAISGGAYKLGGIRALDDFLLSRDRDGVSSRFTVNDFDCYVGLSAGSVMSAALVAGIRPDELFDILEGTSKRFQSFHRGQFMRPNVREPWQRVDMYVRKQAEVVANWLKRVENPHSGAPYTLPETISKSLQVMLRLVPTGMFSPWGLERMLRRNLEIVGLSNDFRQAYEQTGRELYVTAVDINRGRKIVFGHDQRYCGVPITHAVTASCAVPFWFRTARVQNPLADQPGEREHLDLTDGGIVRTANVQIALQRGADLIVCYNPFRPIKYENLQRSLYEHGVYALLSQMIRIVLGSRLELSRLWFQNDPAVDADLIYIEPPEDDYVFFLMNPMNVSSRTPARDRGYATVREALAANFPLLRQVFSQHGITIRQPRGVAQSSVSGRDEMRAIGTESAGLKSN